MNRQRPLFLERSSYRRRRLGDASRILPVLALVLVLVPVWWVPEAVSLTGGALWFFGLWVVLVSLTALLDHALHRWEQGRGTSDEDDEGHEGGADVG